MSSISQTVSSSRASLESAALYHTFRGNVQCGSDNHLATSCPPRRFIKTPIWQFSEVVHRSCLPPRVLWKLQLTDAEECAARERLAREEDLSMREILLLVHRMALLRVHQIGFAERPPTLSKLAVASQTMPSPEVLPPKPFMSDATAQTEKVRPKTTPLCAPPTEDSALPMKFPRIIPRAPPCLSDTTDYCSPQLKRESAKVIECYEDLILALSDPASVSRQPLGDWLGYGCVSNGTRAAQGVLPVTERLV